MKYETRKLGNSETRKLGNAIRNCLRQDFINEVLFLRLIKYVAGGRRVLQ